MIIEHLRAKVGFRFAVLFCVAALFLFWCLENLAYPPEDQISAYIALQMLELYSDEVSPLGSSFITCKFTPTCSDYMRLAILRNGSMVGAGMGLWRIFRCSPITGHGGYDYP